MEKKLIVLSEQRYNPSQMILFVAGAMSFFEDWRWLSPLAHSFNAFAMIWDTRNFHKKVEDISEIVKPKLKNGYEFSRLEASYGFSTVYLQSILGITSGLISVFGLEKTTEFLNSKIISNINKGLAKFSIKTLQDLTSTQVSDFSICSLLGVAGIGMLNVFFGQDSAKAYAVYKMPELNPILEDLPIIVSEDTPQNIPSQKEMEVDIEEVFKNTIEDNNLGMVLSLDESLCYN
jgi:hypothetical protein